jgi:4'-phosphopantetheinyl transferase EntD
VPGEQRAPAWPIGIVGSLTHCTGYRAAAVARDDVLRGVGIDAEPDEPLPPEVLDLVSRPAERSRLRELTQRHPVLHADRLLFCAKEAVYKVWYPLTRRWLGFEAADITIDPSLGRLTAKILAPGPVSELTGRWTVHCGVMVAAICLDHGAGA